MAFETARILRSHVHCTNKLSRRLIVYVRSVWKGRERPFRARERREKRVSGARSARGIYPLFLFWYSKLPLERNGARKNGRSTRLGFEVQVIRGEDNVILWSFIASRTKMKILEIRGVRGSHNFNTDISVGHGIDWNTKATGKPSKNITEKNIAWTPQVVPLNFIA